MFRGKESLNRSELYQLVQELLNFGVSGSLWLGGWVYGVGVVGGGGWVDGVGGSWGCPPHMCTCMCMDACTHTHCMCGKHDNFMQMASPIGFGEIPGIPYYVICACMHACMHVHVCRGHPLTTPTPIHPAPQPQGGPRNWSKFNST